MVYESIKEQLKKQSKQYFEHGNLLLLNIDCMDALQIAPDNLWHLSCVDPPYGIGMGGGKIGGDKCGITKDYKQFHGEDIAPPEETYFRELERVSRNQIIWGANHFMDKVKKGSPCWVVWDKENTGNFADCELAYTSFSTAVRVYRFKWNGMIQGDMKNKEQRIHPTQKPVKLYNWLLTNYAEKGQKILDTHLGSGSSAIAAHYFGCEFVGCELDKGYYEASIDRIEKSTRQLEFCL